MATPSREAVQTFMSITGASESLARRKLEEYGGNLDAAVSAHFLEVERNMTHSTLAAPSQSNFGDRDDRTRGGTRGILPLISAVRSFKPSMLLDPNYRRNLFNQITDSNFNSRSTSSHTGEGRVAPLEFHGGNEHIQDLTGTSQYHGAGVHDIAAAGNESNVHNNDIELEIIQAAIEASKHERGQLQNEDDDLARALSLSLKTAEEENAVREQTLNSQYGQLGIYGSSGRSEKNNCSSSEVGSSSIQQVPVSHVPCHDTRVHLEHDKGGTFNSEWGGMSSKELYEAIMIENQFFGKISKDASDASIDQPPKHCGPTSIVDQGHQALSRPPSSSLMEQRLLREQQDDAYLASLLADREKDLSALSDSEFYPRKEEAHSKKLAVEESKGRLATKPTLLSEEPAIDDENSVSLLIRMPDGSRCGRRFLKSDKLQLLFDYINVTKMVKPGTYRVVRPFPRCAFSTSDSSLSLSELGLTGKQEALFLELI